MYWRVREENIIIHYVDVDITKKSKTCCKYFGNYRLIIAIKLRTHKNKFINKQFSYGSYSFIKYRIVETEFDMYFNGKGYNQAFYTSPTNYDQNMK